jgi:probable HAF family extracellular repeat protein
MPFQQRASIFTMLRNLEIKLFPGALLLLAAVATLLAAGSGLPAQTETVDPATTYKFTSFQPFAAATFSVAAIDNGGAVTGYYLNSSKVYEGYERSAKGIFTIIDDSTTPNTEAAGIDSKGTEIVGNVCIKVECQGASEATPETGRHGCLCENTAGFLYKNSAFTQYEFEKVPNTAIDAINDNGVFVGSYVDPTTKLSTGFISNGNTISYEGKATTLSAINDNGIIIGSGAGSFRANTSGKILATFKFPGATSTIAWGINNLGGVVGWFVDSAGLTHGFVLQKGTYTQIDVPGTNGTTACHGINDNGTITGTYLDASNKLWGFIAAP